MKTKVTEKFDKDGKLIERVTETDEGDHVTNPWTTIPCVPPPLYPTYPPCPYVPYFGDPVYPPYTITCCSTGSETAQVQGQNLCERYS